jgi:hypothetical protein
MNLDEIEIEIMEDGRIKILTDKVSMPNHTNADKFIKDIGRLLGGEVVRQKRNDAHRHITTTEHQRNHQ